MTFLSLRRKPYRGYILPLAMILSTLILLVSFGITSIIVRQARFSRIMKESFIAFNAADLALTCSMFVDDNYYRTTGLFPTGFFPVDVATYPIASTSDEIAASLSIVNNDKASRGLPAVTLSDISCGSVPIFDVSKTGATSTDYTYNGSVTQNGKKTTFSLKLPLSNGEYRCATVIVNKTQSYRQIISSGYSTCDVSDQNRLERVIVSSDVF